MTEENTYKNLFQNYAKSAQSGEFLIDDDVANKLIKRCQEHVVELGNLQNECINLVHTDAYGDLGSAQSYAKSIRGLAIGGEGSGSMHAALEERKQTVQAMADMFTKARDAFLASDEETKDRIRAQMKNLDT